MKYSLIEKWKIVLDPVTDVKMLALSKLKAFADVKFDITKNIEYALSPTKWHSTNTYLSSLGLMDTEPVYFPTQQQFL